MNLQEEVTNALATLNLPVVKYLNEYDGDYPIIVYREISNVPDIHADNQEFSSRVMYQISIGTDDDNYFSIEKSVIHVMCNLGFMRVDSQDIFDGTYWRVIRFSIVEVNDFE